MKFSKLIMAVLTVFGMMFLVACGSGDGNGNGGGGGGGGGNHGPDKSGQAVAAGEIVWVDSYGDYYGYIFDDGNLYLVNKNTDNNGTLISWGEKQKVGTYSGGDNGTVYFTDEYGSIYGESYGVNVTYSYKTSGNTRTISITYDVYGVSGSTDLEILTKTIAGEEGGDGDDDDDDDGDDGDGDGENIPTIAQLILPEGYFWGYVVNAYGMRMGTGYAFYEDGTCESFLDFGDGFGSLAIYECEIIDGNLILGMYGSNTEFGSIRISADGNTLIIDGTEYTKMQL